MIVNFIVLKWGTKYHPLYVNRLYKHLKNTYGGDFNFYCFTDDSTGILSDVIIKDIETLRPTKTNCFTIEKIYLFDPSITNINGPCVLLDLDILLINDLSLYLNKYNFEQPRFIKNYWNNVEYGLLLRKFGRNWLNSSFVTWVDDQLKFVIDFYNDNKQIIEFKYGDLDFFLFNTIRDQLHFHPKGVVYSYIDGADTDDTQSKLYRPDYSLVLFNTSHGRGEELHDAKGWPQQMWTKFD